MSDREELVEDVINDLLLSVGTEETLIRNLLRKSLESYTKNELEYIIYGE